jgi:Xaa-Pro aminopeptidase
MSSSGKSWWFVNDKKVSDVVRDGLPGAVEILPEDVFLSTLRHHIGPAARVLIDPDFSPAAVFLEIEEAGGTAVERPSPLTLTKATKNGTELNGFRACHIQDGVAWTEFSAWLAGTVPARAADGTPVTEIEAEEKILSFRQAQSGFIYESFRSISAAAGHAALCHYAATAASNAEIVPETPYLLDSGGQYANGTTDATRSFAFGTLPDGYAEAYTAVFKAFHALATLRFPTGTQGHHIDAICRRPLWDLGLDYDHGTGHGVGQCLSVHEQPQRIGKIYNPVDLRPGMVLSIEPGFYQAGSFGIRIENLFEIVEAPDSFMEFHSLTYAPIQTDMLLRDRLTDDERNWLDTYHAGLVRILTPYLSDPAARWLQIAAAPLSD